VSHGPSSQSLTGACGPCSLAAASLAPMAVALEASLKRDTLSHALEHRQTAEELKHEGIIRGTIRVCHAYAWVPLSP
jgi:hypothetical protein